MTNQLFYQIVETDEIMKTIQVYNSDVYDTYPMVCFEIPNENNNIIEEIIQQLNDNGYGDNIYSFIQLPSREKQKEFCLEQLSPYFKNPKTCGIDIERDICVYLTNEGNMCVAGKNFLPEVIKQYRNNYKSIPIHEVLRNYSFNQAEVFIPESVNKLTTIQWWNLQKIHDLISKNKHEKIKIVCEKDLKLFTYDELVLNNISEK